MNYTEFVTAIAGLLVVPSNDPDFQAILPRLIDDAELRLYRGLDLQRTITRDSSSSFTAGSRNFTLPTSNGTFVTVGEVNAISPASATTADGGTRNPLTPSSMEALDFLWPSVTGSTVPQYFAMVNESQIIVGPWPDSAYLVEVVGTIRPGSLSASNTTTILSVYFPDCLVAAGMVFGSAWQMNFGTAVDNPREGVTWEQHLQELLKSAQVEEARKKFTAEGWSSKQPTPIATPPRT